MSQIEVPQYALSLDNLELLAKAGVQVTHFPSYRRLAYINPRVRFEPPCVVQAEMFPDGPLSVGAFSGLFGGRLRLTNVGRYCSIATGIQTGLDDHPSDRLTSSMITYVDDVHGWASYCDFNQQIDPLDRFKSVRGITEIGNDVWIGLNVFVRTGVKIGDGAIVAAGSIVTKDVKPYTIVAGNPARVIKQRFDDLTCERLMQSRWWEYSIFDIPSDLIRRPNEAIDWLNDAISTNRINKYSPESLSLI